MTRMRRILALWLAMWTGGCAATPAPATPAKPDPVVVARSEMHAALGPTAAAGFTQTHGPLLFAVHTDRATAVRINRFATTLLARIGPWFRPPDRPIKVFIFDTKAALAPHLTALLGTDAPAEPDMGRYYDGSRTVTCSMEWGLGWLGDLCLRALAAGDWRGAAKPPNRWFPVAMQSVLYNCFRTPDGRFHALNVASYYRPQAQALKDSGTLVPLVQFLRDDYDAGALVGDALRVQGRTVLAWLLARGKFRAFYTEFRLTGATDPSGITALEKVMGRSSTAIAAEWERWLMAADAEIGSSEMAKPFPVLGVLIARPPQGANPAAVTIFETCPGGPAERDGLRPGDQVLTVDGKPVPTRAMLLSVLQAGAFRRTAKIGIRRGAETLTVEIMLDRLIDG
jgi:hypothetical protein